jgi:hypothetical protein
LVEVARCWPVQQADSDPKREFDLTALQRVTKLCVNRHVTRMGAESWMEKRVVTVPADAYGGYAEYCIGPTAMTFEMPDDMSDADASAFFMPFHLAWLGLEHRARVQPGETVLVPVDTWVGKGLPARVDGDKAEHRSPCLGTTMSQM